MEVLRLGCGLPQPYLLRNTLPRQRHRWSLFGSATSQSFPRLSPKSGASLACVKGSSTHALFLPFLQQVEEEKEEEEEEEEDDDDDDDNEDEDGEVLEEEEENKEEMSTSKLNDPIMNFFKTRIEDPNTDSDPDRLGKFSLRKNRKTSWHLSQFTDSSLKNDEVEEKNGYAHDNVELQTITRVEGVVGEILEKARTLPENVTLGEVLKEFEGRIGEKECIEVLGLLEEEGLVKCCLFFFEWMRMSEPSLLSPRASAVLFPILGRARLGKELMFIFRSLPNHKHFRNVRVYNSAMSGLLTSQRYDDAWAVYEIMKTHKVKPDHVTCSILLTGMRKARNTAKEAWELFEKMNKGGAMWSHEVVGALVKSFCDEGLKREALIIQSEMEKRGISSNAIIYNTIMDAYGKSNQIEEAEGILAEMKMKGITPTSSTYNILMDAYSRRAQPEVVEKLLEEMKNTGLEPNVKSYTCLINAYGRQKKMSHLAADAFLRMKKVGIKPSSHSYTALIHAHSASGWHEKAYVAFENMRREGVKPAIHTYTALLDASRRAGDTQTLMKIWKTMIKHKISGTRVTFNTLLDGFAKHGHYVEARDVICEFAKIGLQPTVITYNMLMNAYARGGQDSKLPQLLQEMEARNLKPDSVTYSTMIYAFVRVRDFKRAFYFHEQMVQSGEVPDAESYQKLRAILDAKAAIKNKKDRRALKGIIKSSMGVLQKQKRKKDELWKKRKNRERN